MNDHNQPSGQRQAPEKLLAAINTFSPRATRRMLTEGYQPTGSDVLPASIPNLVSGVYFPGDLPKELLVEEPPSPPEANPSTEKSS